MHFSGKSKAQQHIKIDAILCSGYLFLESKLGDGAELKFFSGFTDKGEP